MKTTIKIYALLTLFCYSSIALAAEFYRFKNDEGRHIVNDQLTNEMIAKGYEILNAEGRVIKIVGPGKTLAQEEEERLKIIEEKKKKIALQQKIRNDAELLRQFSSIGDIIRNRDAQLLALEQRIKIQGSKSDLLKLQLEDQQRQAATHERLGQALPKLLKEDIATSKEQIEENKRNALLLEDEKVIVAARYQDDIVRYKELESLRKTLKRDGDKESELRTVIYDCPDMRTCQRAWQLAQVYAKDNASGQIEIITNTLILTSKPETDSQIALSFSRLPAPNDKQQIILEVSCKKSEQGVNLCKSDAVKNVRSGYLKLVQQKI